MLYRPQRGTLAEAMQEVTEFDGSWAGLQTLLPEGVTLARGSGWDTYYIVIGRWEDDETTGGAVGFTNGLVTQGA